MVHVFDKRVAMTRTPLHRTTWHPFLGTNVLTISNRNGWTGSSSFTVLELQLFPTFEKTRPEPAGTVQRLKKLAAGKDM